MGLQQFIKETILEESHIMILTPRKFGKSTAAKSMEKELKDWHFMDDPFVGQDREISFDKTKKICILSTHSVAVDEFLKTSTGSQFKVIVFPSRRYSTTTQN